MMSIALLLLASAALLDAKPSRPLRPTFSNMIIGGEDASPGEFPWQLSQQRLGSTWSHWCGASLLSSQKVLSAAHCVDATDISIVRVIAGLHNQDDTTGTQTSMASSLVLHESYNVGAGSFANDIAIIHLVDAITPGGNIAFAALPADNSNNFAGETCIISGWGRTSNSNILPNTLQKASIGVITTDDCQTRVGDIGTIWDNHICVVDSSGQIGSCNGDSGGPMNCGPEGSMVVSGIASFVVATLLGNCLPEYPSVYTRTSPYLDWISSH